MTVVSRERAGAEDQTRVTYLDTIRVRDGAMRLRTTKNTHKHVHTCGERQRATFQERQRSQDLFFPCCVRKNGEKTSMNTENRQVYNKQHTVCTFMALENACPLRSNAVRGWNCGCLWGLSAFAAASGDLEGFKRACITPVNVVEVALVSPRKWFALLLLLLLPPPPNPGTLNEEGLVESAPLRGALLVVPASKTPC